MIYHLQRKLHFSLLLFQVLQTWLRQRKDAPYTIGNLEDDIISWRKELFIDAAIWETLQPHVDFSKLGILYKCQ